MRRISTILLCSLFAFPAAAEEMRIASVTVTGNTALTCAAFLYSTAALFVPAVADYQFIAYCLFTPPPGSAEF